MKKSDFDLSRRGFLKTGGIAGAAIGAVSVLGLPTEAKAQATEQKSIYETIYGGEAERIYTRKADAPGPVGPIGFEDRVIAKSEIASTLKCDVLVVGAGISGLIASLKAAEEGANVILIEKMSMGRGAFECFGSVNSKIQQAAGVKTDKEALIDELHRCADYRIRPDVVRTYVDNSGEATDFLDTLFKRGERGFVISPMPMRPKYPNIGMDTSIDAELMFYNTPNLPADVRFRSGHVGVYIIQDLTNTMKKNPKITSYYDSPAAQLVTNKSGRVTGVIAKQGDKYVQINASKGVILSTGGYDANPDMMRAYLRPEDYSSSSWWNPCWGTTGDGHMMGLKVGAAMDPTPHSVMNFTFGSPESFHIPEVRTLRAMGLYAIVNDDGKRFVREDVPFQSISNATNTQWTFGKKSYLLFDETMIANDKAIFDKAVGSFPMLKAKGWLFEGNSPAALAKAAGIDSKNLAKTITDYNRYKKQNKDEEFNRDMEFAVAFTGKKYYALVCNSVILATVSGLIINGNGQVLNTKGDVIQGLYATGNASGDLFSGNYPRHIPGTSIGRAITLGYVSARHAVRGK